MNEFPQVQIFYPMLVMFLHTLLCLQVSLWTRVHAVKTRKVRMSHFKTFEGESTERIKQVGNHANNLFQAPHLFYVICLLILHFQKVDGVFVGLAWAYVGFRMLHSMVHLSYNRVPHRLAGFLLSMVTLVVMWVRTAVVL